MEDYLKRIINNDLSIIHGVYEPPNDIPVMRYMINKKNYKIILIGDDSMRLSCIRWLSTENLIPKYIFNKVEDIDNIDNSLDYFVIISDLNYHHPSYHQKLMKKLNEYGINYYLSPYDYEKIPKHEINYLDYFRNNEKKLIETLNMLEDEESKRTYIEYIRSKAFCDFYRLTQHPTWNKYFDRKVYKHLENEIFVNCGSSNGDTIFYFLENFDTFNKIYALETDKDRVKQFKNNMLLLPNEINKKINLLNTFVDNNKNKMDYYFVDEEISLINMDIEGMELEALKGAKKIILQNNPVIASCAYHLPTDLYELPMYLKNLSDNYHIFYRKYASTVRNRFCNAELVMYAVPEKRIIKK